MTRPLSTEMQAAVSADFAEYVHLIELDFSGGVVRLSTGAQDLNWNSATWEAVGGLLELGGIEETPDSKGQGVDLRLSGVDTAIVAILLSEKYRGRTVRIYLAHLDTQKGTVIDAVLRFEGLQISPYTVEEERERGGGTVSVTTRIIGMLGLERWRGIQTNVASHSHHFAGETFFQHTPSLSNTKIYWGTNVPQSPGRNRRREATGDYYRS